MHDHNFTAHHGLTPAQQLDWIESLRKDTAALEFLTPLSPTELPEDHPWRALPTETTHGVGPRLGYENRQPDAWLYRVPYDRSLVRAMRDAGGLFDAPAGVVPGQDGPCRWGDVDVYFLDARGAVLGAAIAHEGLVFTRR